MNIDTSYVMGDEYVNERIVEHKRNMKLHYQITAWFFLATGTLGAAYAMWDSKWWLVGFLVMLALCVTRSVETHRSETLFILGSLENRGRILEARTDRIAQVVERMDRASRPGARDF